MSIITELLGPYLLPILAAAGGLLGLGLWGRSKKKQGRSEAIREAQEKDMQNAEEKRRAADAVRAGGVSQRDDVFRD